MAHPSSSVTALIDQLRRERQAKRSQDTGDQQLTLSVLPSGSLVLVPDAAVSAGGVRSRGSSTGNGAAHQAVHLDDGVSELIKSFRDYRASLSGATVTPPAVSAASDRRSPSLAVTASTSLGSSLHDAADDQIEGNSNAKNDLPSMSFSASVSAEMPLAVHYHSNDKPLNAGRASLNEDFGSSVSTAGRVIGSEYSHLLSTLSVSPRPAALSPNYKHSPTATGVSHSSTDILRTVLALRPSASENGVGLSNTQVEPSTSPSQNEDRNSTGVLIGVSMPAEAVDSDQLLNQQHALSSISTGNPGSVALPTPTTHSPQEKLMYFVDYLKHRRHEVRLSALQQLNDLLHEHAFSDNSCAVVSSGLVSCLEIYENQEDVFNDMAVDVLSYLGPSSVIAIPVLMRILRDFQQQALHEKVVKALFLTGELGVQALVESAADAYTQWDVFVLTHLANHPLVQGLVVLPALVREFRATDAARKQDALAAMAQLHQLTTPALPVLSDLLTSGSVDRKRVARTIRNCGAEGERMLIQLIHTSTSGRVRAAAAYGLSIPRLLNPPFLRVLVSTDVTMSFTAVPQLQYLKGTDDDNVRSIVFDVRELISAVRRGLQNGDYAEPVATDFSIRDVDMLGSDTLSPRFMATSDECVYALMNGLQDEDVSVRIESVSALGVVGLPSAYPSLGLLISSLSDSNNKVREACVTTLGLFGPDVAADCVPHVLALLKQHEFWKVRFAAVQALGRFGTAASSSIPVLTKILKDGSVSRNETAIALACLGQSGVQVLIDMLRVEGKANAQVRVSAAFGLSHVNVASPSIDTSIEALFSVSKDRHPSVRKAVLESLSALGRIAKDSVTYLQTRSLLPFLYGFLKDREATVREAAACALADAGPHGELLLIEGVLKDSNSMIRSSAAHGLMCIGARTIRTLLLAMNDREAMVRQSVGRSIQGLGLQAIAMHVESLPTAQRDSVMLSIREVLLSPLPNTGALGGFLSALLSKLETIEEQQASLLDDTSASSGRERRLSSERNEG